MKNNLEHFKAMLLEETNDIVLITDSNLNGPGGPAIQYVNKAFETLTGYTKSEVIGKTPRILQGPKTDKNTIRRIRQALEEKKAIRVELLNYSKSGREYWLDFSVTPLFDDNGEVAYFAAIERDVSQHKELQLNLYDLANKDPLTGAMNRNRFYEASKTLFSEFTRNKQTFALMVIDIDNFKQINDQMGHLEGDIQIKLISSICSSRIRQSDFFCRFGGDEFICIIQNTDKSHLEEKALEFLSAVSNEPVIKTSISIGATIIKQTDNAIDDLIARADQALYDVKKSKKGDFKVI